MQLDWFTVGAQTLNFLILVWLLKRYLYQPILDAIDAREACVAKVLDEAASIKKDAELQRSAFAKKQHDFALKQEKILKDAKARAQGQSEILIFNAHKNADSIAKDRLLAFEKEMQVHLHNFSLSALQEIYEITRKVLSDLADIELEKKMLDCFCKRLANIKAGAKNQLKKTLETGGASLLLSSAFELTHEQIAKVDSVLQEVIPSISGQYTIKHTVNPALIGGIELRVNSWKLAWNSADYLNLLQTQIARDLAEQRETIRSKIDHLDARSTTAQDPV